MIRIASTVLTGFVLWGASVLPSQSQSPSTQDKSATAPQAAPVQSAMAKDSPKPARKPSAFKDDPTFDPRDKELDRRIRSICRGC